MVNEIVRTIVKYSRGATTGFERSLSEIYNEIANEI